MFYDNLMKLCNERGVKVTNVVTALGLSSGNMSKWKEGREPNTDTAKKFADFFSVPVGYLLDDADTDVTNLPPEIVEIMEITNGDSELLNKALDFIRFMKSQREK